jgi:hypothetical protein
MTLSEFRKSDHQIEMRCRCRVRIVKPAEIPDTVSGDVLVSDLPKRFRCQSCGQRPVFVRMSDPNEGMPDGG